LASQQASPPQAKACRSSLALSKPQQESQQQPAPQPNPALKPKAQLAPPQVADCDA
jgi:hypothetical protein